MDQHAKRLQHIRELCDQLTGAVDASFRIREHAEELKRAAEELALSAPPERRSIPRVKNAVTKPPTRSDIDDLIRSRLR